MNNSIPSKIIEFLRHAASNLTVADVRIGLGYSSVRLSDGHAGVAWTAQRESGSCTHEVKAGTLAGSPAADLLAMLDTDKPLARTIGLATANALAAGLPRPSTTTAGVLDLIDLKPSDHTVMVGFFGPLVPRIRQTGCRFDILEMNRDKPGTMAPEDGLEPLAACSVAIITATSVVTGTIDDLLAGLGNPRAAVILGPSTFMRPEVFAGTKVTHLAGVRVRDAAAVEKVVSEGGGTMILKPFMDFETICLGSLPTGWQ